MPPLTRKRKATQASIATPGSKISSNAVFQITELLEQILEHLSWRNLYRCLRVCRRFNELISDSNLLRQKMILFRPGSGTPLWSDEPISRLDHYPLDQPTLSSMTMRPVDFGLESGQRVNPLLLPWRTYLDWKTSRGPRPRSIPFTLTVASGRHWAEAGSWRELFLTDPPVKEAFVRLVWNVKDAGAFRFNGGVQCEEGLTFGKMIDLVMAESSKAWTFIGYTHRLGDANKKILDVPGDTPAETIRRLEKRLGGKAQLQGEKSYVTFRYKSF